jgi:hypothetical protein
VTSGAAAAVPQRKAIAAMVNVAQFIVLLLSLCHCSVESKRGRIRHVKYWEIIADNLDKSGWRWAVSQVRITRADNFGL